MSHTVGRMPEAVTLPTGTVTFLMTDIEGSTRGWFQSPAALTAAIPRHYQILDDAIVAHGGVRPVEQGEGDSVVAAFSRASDAVHAALLAQRSLTAEQWLDGVALKVRMAVHTGEAQLRDEANYCGVAPIRCARIRACGHGGQILVSNATAQLIADTLPNAATLIDLGWHRLKDLGRPERLWQLTHPDLEHHFPPLQSLAAYRHNLPMQLNSFVGRGAELAVLDKLVPETRILTLTGSGGCGKTRLAIELAAVLLDHYPDGVWVIELAPINAPDLVAPTALRALGLRDEQAFTPAETLTRYLRDRQAMLILDNCEHLLPACAELAEAVARACPSVHVLATSREPLSVAGELPWRVPSLSTPTDTAEASIDTLDVYESVRLFVDRARQARPNFSVTNDNAPAVAEICHRLDGIPLAIELAAARTRILTPQQICDGLPDRFRLLVGGSRTATHRQQTLQASVDWSYQLLDDDERTLLHRMSVFAGAVTLDAVEGVCDGHGLERLAILDVLTGLIDKSLVVVDDDGPAARYRLLETIRQYADVRLAESGDKDRVSTRHRDYFLTLAEHIEPRLFGADQDQATAELLDAQPNLAAAFEWSDNHGDTEAMLRFVCATFYYFVVRGMVAQGRTWAEASLAPGDGDPGLRARALVAHGHLAIFGSDFASAGRAAAAAMEIASADEATRLRAEGLAAEVTALGDPAGIPGFAANLEAARARHDLWWLSDGTCTLHFAHLIAGDLVEARRAIDEALAVTAVSHDPFEERQALGATAFLAAWQGDVTSAIDLAEPIVEAARSNHDTSMLTLGLAALAFAKTHRGEYEYARTIADEAVEIGLETASVFTTPALLARGNLAFCEGDFQTMHAIEQSLRPVGEASNTPYAERYRSLLSLAYTLNGNTALGRQTLADADQTANNAHATQHLWAQAILERAEGELVEAEATAHRCLSICRTTKFATVEVEAIEVLAGLAADVESHDVAARLLGAADARRVALGYVRPPIIRPGHDSDVATLIDAVGSERYERVLAEGTAMSWDEALDYVTRGRGQRKRPSTGWASLTPAELAVVNLVSDGMSNQQVADRLFIGRRTVGTHLTHIFAKLGVTSRAELTAAALRRAR